MRGNSINITHLLFRDSSLSLFIRIGGLVLQIVVFALIARAFPLEIVGIYAIINTGWILVRFIGPLGYNQVALRFVSQYFEKNEYGKSIAFANHVTKRIFWFSSVITVALIILSIVMIILFPAFTANAWLTFLFALGLPAYALSGLYIALLRAHGDILHAQFPDAILVQFIIGLGALLLLALNIIDIRLLLIAQLCAIWVVLAIYIWLWRRVIIGDSAKKLDKSEQQNINAMARSVLGGLSATALAASAPVLLISVTLGSAAAGLMEAARRFGILASLTTWAVGISVSPLMARAHYRDDKKGMQSLFTLASLLQTLPAFTIFIGLLIFGQWLLIMLLGAEFEAAYQVMILLALATMINASGATASSYLLMVGGEKIVLYFSLASLVIIIIGIPLAAMVSGLIGAGLVLVLSSIIRDLGMTFFVALRHDMRPGIWSLTELKRIRGILPQIKKIMR